MGGLGSGRQQNEAQGREAARLRGTGLSLGEIGRCLGVTRQRVAQILQAIERKRTRSLSCRVCGRVASPPGVTPGDAEHVLCLSCLECCPEAPFTERLRSCRVAAGLSRVDLATRVGLTTQTVRFYEAGERRPQQRNLMPLVEVLGPLLVTSREADRARP